MIVDSIMNKTALITGASGQDALLLSQYLLNIGYNVYAMARRVARPDSRFVTKLLENPNYKLVQGDITDFSTIVDALQKIKPDEFYNLAAQSHVGISFQEPISTVQITGVGVLNCLEAIRKIKPDTRFYQASSSEMFGGTKTNVCAADFLSGDDIGKYSLAIINENTPFEPRSPYACAKVLGHSLTKNYREAYGLHASCGILFNHESEFRKPSFVTRKVTAYVAELDSLLTSGRRNNIPKLKLGCLDFARDRGCAGDFTKAMHLMLQQNKGDDYVVATGKVHTGKELLEVAFSQINEDWSDWVELDRNFSRPTDVKVLVGNASKAERVLGWKPQRDFKKLILDMLDNDKMIYKEFGVINE